MDDDPRFTYGLMHDVREVLESYGYRLPEGEQERHAALGASTVALLHLVETFEGCRPP
ncbi:hypothetical protein [Streptosporangium sp. G12]